MSERNTRIIEMARSGATYKATGRQFGISAERVRQIVVPVLGMRQSPGRRVSEKEVATFVDMAKRGLCVADIARCAGRSFNAVADHLSLAGVEALDAGDIFGDDLRAKAVAMVAAGASYGDAAHALGMTKNAVAGAVHRARRRKAKAETVREKELT